MQSGLICAPQQMIAEEPLAAQIGYVSATAVIMNQHAGISLFAEALLADATYPNAA
jgi:hypothetical protein